LDIEFISFRGPLIPNPIGKLFTTASIALSRLGKLLKTDKLNSSHLIFIIGTMNILLRHDKNNPIRSTYPQDINESH
jgi:hypothetical protein